MRCRLCFRWRQFSKLRARLLDVEEQPRRGVTSRFEMKRRCQSISSRPLEERRKCQSKTTSSIINDDTTHDTTSTNIVAVDTGMQRSAVTAPTVAGDTTATRTGWPQNHRALECSAERSAARRCPARFDPPTIIAKCNGKTKLELWLTDIRLACQLGGARGDDRTIIQQLPLFLSDTARRWLEELPANQIHNWTDLVRVFKGNFKGTYIRPGNSWDLSKCKQKSGETLREYAQRFSKQRTELPHIPDHDVILAFVSGTTSRDLVRELGQNRPWTVDELMDVDTC